MCFPHRSSTKAVYVICRSNCNKTSSSEPSHCLNKQPGVRPIGIGDTAHRIIAKAVLTIVALNIQDATGCRQMCGGQISVIEVAIHATRAASDLEENEAIVLVDATNASTHSTARWHCTTLDAPTHLLPPYL